MKTAPDSTSKIAIIGLGYVGLPLAVEFGKGRPVVGFDINTVRVNELEHGVDIMKDLTAEEISEAIRTRLALFLSATPR